MHERTVQPRADRPVLPRRGGLADRMKPTPDRQGSSPPAPARDNDAVGMPFSNGSDPIDYALGRAAWSWLRSTRRSSSYVPGRARFRAAPSASMPASAAAGWGTLPGAIARAGVAAAGRPGPQGSAQHDGDQAGDRHEDEGGGDRRAGELMGGEEPRHGGPVPVGGGIGEHDARAEHDGP